MKFVGAVKPVKIVQSLGVASSCIGVSAGEGSENQARVVDCT